MRLLAFLDPSRISPEGILYQEHKSRQRISKIFFSGLCNLRGRSKLNCKIAGKDSPACSLREGADCASQYQGLVRLWTLAGTICGRVGNVARTERHASVRVAGAGWLGASGDGAEKLSAHENGLRRWGPPKAACKLLALLKVTRPPFRRP